MAATTASLTTSISLVAQCIGVYTAKDYADILKFLIVHWKVADLTELSSKGKEAQEYLCTLIPRFRRLEERVRSHATEERSTMPFSWIYGREVRL